uniref:Uncharacterized protein n=1 Tax=Strigamia maritima TaxID=126957 RepID=T1JIT7_STRMM
CTNFFFCFSVKPVLKKINKYNPDKFKIIKPTEINFHQNLKKVESNKFSIEGIEKEKAEKPEWALGAKEKREEGEVEE